MSQGTEAHAVLRSSWRGYSQSEACAPTDSRTSELTAKLKVLIDFEYSPATPPVNRRLRSKSDYTIPNRRDAENAGKVSDTCWAAASDRCLTAVAEPKRQPAPRAASKNRGARVGLHQAVPACRKHRADGRAKRLRRIVRRRPVFVRPVTGQKSGASLCVLPDLRGSEGPNDVNPFTKERVFLRACPRPSVVESPCRRFGGARNPSSAFFCDLGDLYGKKPGRCVGRVVDLRNAVLGVLCVSAV
jgi:hypothetical protein